MVQKGARELEILIALGSKGEMFGDILVSTISLSREIGISQQTISRDLIAMEKQGTIERASSKKGLTIRITKQGYLSLRSVALRIGSILSKAALEMDGTVVSGLGEGGYYVGLKGYRDQFEEALGYVPYPGTLNLSADPALQERFLWDLEPSCIDGFTHGGRTFGALDLYPVRLLIKDKGVPAAIIIPRRTVHPKGVCEVIAETNLRENYGLADGSIIILTKVKQ